MNNEKELKYTEREVRELLQRQAEKLGLVKEVIWETKPNKLKLNVLKVLSTSEGLIIYVI